MTHRTRPGVAAVVVSLLVLGGACSGDDHPDLGLPDEPRSAPTGGETARDETGSHQIDDQSAPSPAQTFHVAQATGETLVVQAAAQEGQQLTTLAAADQVSGKVVCLVVQQVGDWVEVQLPTGEPGTTGWVARDDVSISRHRFRIEVSRSQRTLTLYAADIVALTAPVALGPDAPAAGEHRFVKELVQPPDPAGPYRTYAYGLSGAANDHGAFLSGAGVVAVHGVADPAALRADVPRGSIGVGGDIVTRMVESIGLPLGTPVDIVE